MTRSGTEPRPEATVDVVARLSRQTITRASWMMLPAYPLIAGWLGFAYALGNPARTSSSSLDPARDLMPIRAWGIAFLSLAILMVLGYATRSRDVTVFVLYAAAMAFVLWSLSFGVAVVIISDASFVGPMWPLFAAWACYVSAGSVGRQEVSVRGGRGD